MRSQIIALSLFCLAGWLANHANAQETLSVSVLNGTEIRCYPDSLVRIEITPNTDFDFSLIVVDWGDGFTQEINPGEPLILEHEYPIAQFLEDCTYDNCGTERGFCFQLVIDAAYGGETPPENISKRITFKFPPRPDFETDLIYICTGVEVAMNNFTCPENDESMRFYWSFPDGSTSEEAEPQYVFDAPGIYQITLSAVNDCDSVTVTKNVFVNELAEAEIGLELGFEDTDSEPYAVCIGDGGKVSLTANASLNITVYNWSIDPTDDVTLETNPGNDSLCIQFDSAAAGMYTIELVVDNACDIPDTAQIEIEVIPEPSLDLQGQEDACLSLEYAPEPLQPGVIYNLNGTEYTDTDFPITLTESDDPYFMEAIAGNRCDSLLRRDTFFVFGEFNPSIIVPSQDTVICRDTSLLLLATDGEGDGWSVDNGAALIFDNGNVFFDLDQADGEYALTFSQGFGDCEGTDSRVITIQSPDVSTNGPWQFCADTGLQTLTATSGGGSWSGAGVADPDGTYDPGSVAPGLYEVYYTYSDASFTGCVTTLTDTVEVVGLPDINGSPASFSLCEVDQVLSLPAVAGVELSPEDGMQHWTGEGIVDAASGDYNPRSVAGNTDTVTLTYTIEPGCVSMATIVVDIGSLTPVDAGEDITLCDDQDNPTLTAEPAGEGRWIGPGIDETTGEIAIDGLNAGQIYEYVYIINEDLPSCVNSDTVQVDVVSGEGVSLPFNDTYLCDTASFILLPGGSPSTGIWSGSPGLSSDTLYLDGLMPDTFDLVYTIPELPAACNSSALTVYLSPQPIVSILSDSTACIGEDCLPFSAVTGGAAAFEWGFGDGSNSNESDPCHTYSATGAYPVELVGYLVQPGTNLQYCASEPANTTVEVLGGMEDVTIEASSLGECPDFLVDLSPSLIDSRYIYTWSVAGIQDSTASSLNDVLLEAAEQDTTYTVTLSATNGCDARMDSMELTALAPFEANVGTDFDTPCSGETVSLYNLSTGIDNENLQWSLSNGIEYTGFEPPAFQVFTDSVATPLEVRLVGNNACNSDTAFYTLDIQPADVRARMNFSDDELCAGTDLVMANISTPGANVRWVTSDGNNYQADTVRHIFSEPGPAWVTIYAEGCGYDSLRYPFEILPRPELELEVDPVACAGQPVTFTVSGNAAAQVLYYGTGDSTLLNNSTYTYPAVGSYNVRLYGRSAAGCRDSLQREVQVAPVPTAAVAPVDSVCVGETVSLSSQSTGASSCLWILADEATIDNCETSYAFQSAGLQLSTLVVTSNLGCRDSTTFPVYVRPTPEAAFEYLGSDNCSPAQVQFTYTGNGPTPDSWQWALGDGTTATVTNPQHTYNFGGAYEVTLKVGVEGICFDSTRQNIVVRGTPQFDTLTLDERCLPTDAFVVEVDTDGANELTLTGEDYFQAGINRFELTEPGDYELEVLSPDGCDTTLQFTVPQVFPLDVQLMPDTTILLGASVRIISEVNASGLFVDWTPTESLDDATGLEPIATPGQTTTYVMSVSDGACIAKDTVTIFVDEEVRIYVPNAFSPNGDGVNDIFSFYPVIGVDTVLSCRIYDRWGQQVYDSEEQPMRPVVGGFETWDGMFRGEYRNPDVFAYHIELLLTNGKRKVLYGDLQLVR